MKRKFDKKIISSLIISLVSIPMVQAVAQGVSTQSSTTISATAPTIPSLPGLTVPDVSGAPDGCNKELMQNLNSKYLQTRGDARILQYKNQMNGLVMTTPKANQMDCFQQAMQNIKNLMSAINSIIAMFSGKMDMDALMQQMVNMVLKAACQEINQVTGTVSNSLNTTTNSINTNVNDVKNTTIGNTTVGTTVGGALTAASGTGTNQGATDIVGGSVTSLSNTFGTVTSTANSATSTTSALVNKIESVSPFSGSGN